MLENWRNEVNFIIWTKFHGEHSHSVCGFICFKKTQKMCLLVCWMAKQTLYKHIGMNSLLNIYITLSIVFGSEFRFSLYSISSKMWFRSTRKPVMLWNTVHYISFVFLPVCRLPSIVEFTRVTWRTAAHLASKHNYLEFICAWHLCWQTSGFARQIIVILLHMAIHVFAQFDCW